MRTFLMTDEFGEMYILQAEELPPEVIDAIEDGIMSAVRWESSTFQEWDKGKWIEIPPFGSNHDVP